MNAMRKWGFGAIGLLAGFFASTPLVFAQEDVSDPRKATLKNEQEALEPVREDWAFSGPFGVFDRAQLQRGYMVYNQVCSNCHSMKEMSFRNLSDKGGPEFSEAQVKALAATVQVTDGPNDQGEMYQRPGRPADYFPWKFANAEAARAALGGALPPDMSVLAKARTYERGFPRFVFDAFTQYQEEGPDYIVSLLNGYRNAPPNVNIGPGQYYNIYFPGHKIGMPPPLQDGLVAYTDGSPQTTLQYSRDIAAFLYWVSDPKLQERKTVGFRVMAFLIVFAGLMYVTKKKVWANVHGETNPS